MTIKKAKKPKILQRYLEFRSYKFMLYVICLVILSYKFYIIGYKFSNIALESVTE